MRLFGYYPCETCRHAIEGDGCHRDPDPSSPRATGPWDCDDWELIPRQDGAAEEAP